MKNFTSTIVIIMVLVAGWVEAGLSATSDDYTAPRMMCADRFTAMDKNQDKQVDKEEFMAVDHPRGNAEQIFKSRDTDADGLLTQEEFCAGRGMGQGGRGRGRMQ